MKAVVYKIKKRKLIKLLELVKDKLIINDINFHNLSRLSEYTDNVFKFNIYFNQENEDVLSKETWYKIHNVFINTNKELMIIEVLNENMSNLTVIIKELEAYLDIQVKPIKINEVFRKVKKEKELSTLQLSESDKIVNKNASNDISNKDDIYSLSYHDGNERIFIRNDGFVEFQNIDSFLMNAHLL